MMRFADLTLATTAHNNAEMSAAMLRSFETNVGEASEIVMVDDASSSVYVAPPSLRMPMRIIRTKEALGFCKASDLALRNVQTRYALLVDADVLFEPGDFAGGFEEFRKSKWAWVNFQQVNFNDEPQNSFEQPLMPPWIFAAGNQVFGWWNKRHPVPEPARGERIAKVDAVHSSCTLVDMEAFRAIGGFDPWYWQCQSDVDISLRFREKNYRVGVDTGYRVKHEGSGGKTGGTARVLDLYRSRVRLYERAYPASRIYLRPMLFLRHLLEVAWFALLTPFGGGSRVSARVELMKGALKGYD